MDVSPRYTIHQYSEDIFKVVAFKGVRDSEYIKLRDREEEQHYDTKLNEAFCRAKSMVLQYALCNDWDYFFTGTLDKAKFNRYDLDSFQRRLSQFIRDKRKAYGTQVSFLLVPEQHKDGAWHMHGLISGLPDSVLRRFRPPEPEKLVHSDYLNWPDYMQRFGFCSLGPVRHPVATSFYISKYVSKELSRRGGQLGKHLYFHSRPLNKAVHVSNVYFYNSGLTFTIRALTLCVFMSTSFVKPVWYKLLPGTFLMNGRVRSPAMSLSLSVLRILWSLSRTFAHGRLTHFVNRV